MILVDDLVKLAVYLADNSFLCWQAARKIPVADSCQDGKQLLWIDVG